jgi:hypothetical protein
VVAGDLGGTLKGLVPKDNAWQMDLHQVSEDGPKSSSSPQTRVDPAARCAAPIRIVDACGVTCHYLLVSSGRELLLISAGKVCARIATPFPVTCMCTGRFMARASRGQNDANIGEAAQLYEEQVLIATKDGIVHVLDGSLKLTSHARVGFQMTSLFSLPATLLEREAGALDMFVCTGHFDGLKVYEGATGALLSSVEVGDWVDAVAVGDIDGDGRCEVGVLVNNTVRVYKVPRGEAADVNMAVS